MSLHEAITTAMHRCLNTWEGAASVSAGALAAAVADEFGTPDEPHTAYAALEGFKHIARGVLSGRYGKHNRGASLDQGQLFAGTLQERYPIASAGGEPVYKLRLLLTDQERNWVVVQLRKSGRAFLKHADALESEAAVLAHAA